MRRFSVFPGIALALITSTGSAQQNAAMPEITPPVYTAPRYLAAQSTDPNAFELSIEEWQRYLHLMQGPRGFWSAQVHPLMVLGFEADTDTERERYAERYAEVLWERRQKEMAFINAYTAAFQRRYGTTVEAMMLEAFGDPKRYSSAERVALFVSPQCTGCPGKIEELLMGLRRGEATGIDIYVLGAKNDAAIRDWARSIRLPPEEVKARRVTLNHDKGLLASLTGRTETGLPYVHRINGRPFNRSDDLSPGQ